ncbi:MAG: DUF3035 domain-containing protein [Hyphomonadaceae bacterium]
MSKPIRALLILAAAASGAGCSSIGKAVGMTKVVPDEFRVVSRAPLTLPPDYSLRPPRPGDPRPQELAPDEEARAALFGQDIGQQASAAERTLVDRAGAEAVDPNIRAQVDFEGANVIHHDQAFVDRLLQQNQSGAADTRTAEQRTAEEEAVRRATGGGTVVIQREGGSVKLPGT